jgi:hypothetical protein
MVSPQNAPPPPPPAEFCAESSPGSGVFRRQWTRATAEFDCTTRSGTVTMSDGTVVAR